MYCTQKAIHIIGFVFTIFISYVIAFPEVDEDKVLKLKLGFDLTQGTNGAPSLQIRNFQETSKSRKLNGHNNNLKRSVRADSSTDSEETEDNKPGDSIKAARESDLSDDAASSGSEENRRISTKGLNPDEFEPENTANIHEKYKEQDSE